MVNLSLFSFKYFRYNFGGLIFLDWKEVASVKSVPNLQPYYFWDIGKKETGIKGYLQKKKVIIGHISR